MPIESVAGRRRRRAMLKGITPITIRSAITAAANPIVLVYPSLQKYFVGSWR